MGRKEKIKMYNTNNLQTNVVQQPMLPYGGVSTQCIDPSMQQKIILKNIEFYQEMNKKEFDNFLKKDLLYAKNEIEERREMRREENRMNREMAQLRGFEDANGRFCVVLHYPDGRKKYSEPVLAVSHIHMLEEITALGNFYRIVWDENQSGVLLKVEEFSTKKLVKALENQGIVFSVSRRKKEETIQQLLQFLYQKKTERQVPCLYGWNKVGNEWVFCKEVIDYE